MSRQVRASPVFLGLLGLAAAGGAIAAAGDPLPLLAGRRDPLLVAGVFTLVAAGWAVSLTLHEFGHAVVAYRGGDYEVAGKGYLALDVRRYTDPVLSIALPLLLLAIGSIPLPGGAVWLNTSALRTRATAMWVSLAGPLTNLALGAALAITIRVVPMPAGLALGLSYLALVEVLAFVLNILPIPGLDGYGALEPYLPPQARRLGTKTRPWAPLALFTLLIAVPAARDAFSAAAGTMFEQLGGSQQLAAFGGHLFRFWT